jgi:DNA-binding LytR/AlgR family response regulator
MSQAQYTRTSLELKQANDFNCANIRNLFEQQLKNSETRLAKTIEVAHALVAQENVDTFEYEETKAEIKRMHQKIHELTQRLQSLDEQEKPPRGQKRKATTSIQINDDQTNDLSTLPIRESKK